jgi:hypothetical protein
MKKVLLVLVGVLFLSTQSVNAQWVKKFYVDDFGDPTTDSYESFMAQGTFSNSATQDSRATYQLMNDGERFLIYIYEYGSRLATKVSSTFQTVKIKTPSGDVVTINDAFFNKSGYLQFKYIKYTKIIETISTPGDYIIIFSGEYSSKYKLNFTIE